MNWFCLYPYFISALTEKVFPFFTLTAASFLLLDAADFFTRPGRAAVFHRSES